MLGITGLYRERPVGAKALTPFSDIATGALRQLGGVGSGECDICRSAVAGRLACCRFRLVLCVICRSYVTINCLAAHPHHIRQRPVGRPLRLHETLLSVSGYIRR
ncbi:hypothetical protein [Mesorhizobium sp.]|uniref:hypothetical protein n=1 Tax=Mesorhizobium sp. TaxID=1871066 RepID=UPI0025D4CE60|nr:hypothetical protein [Mesorhizobium sp.]